MGITYGGTVNTTAHLLERLSIQRQCLTWVEEILIESPADEYAASAEISIRASISNLLLLLAHADSLQKGS